MYIYVYIYMYIYIYVYIYVCVTVCDSRHYSSRKPRASLGFKIIFTLEARV